MDETIIHKIPIWISRIEIRPTENNSENPFSGAICNVLGLAISKNDFENLVTKDHAEDGFEVVSFSDTELYQDRKLNGHVGEKIELLAVEVSNERSIVYSDFFTFSEEE